MGFRKYSAPYPATPAALQALHLPSYTVSSSTSPLHRVATLCVSITWKFTLGNLVYGRTYFQRCMWLVFSCKIGGKFIYCLLACMSPLGNFQQISAKPRLACMGPQGPIHACLGFAANMYKHLYMHCTCVLVHVHVHI